MSRRVAAFLVILGSAGALPARAQSAEEQAQQHFAAAKQDQQAGMLDAAANEYEKVLQLKPGIAEVYANLGLVYYAQSKFSDSAAALGTAAKLKPGLEGVNLWLGVDYIKLGAPDKAVPLLRDAVLRSPHDLLAERWLGTALWNSGQRFPAIDQLAKTCELFPSDIDSYFVLGEAYRKAADEETEDVLALASGTPLVHQIYGDIYRDQHAWVRAAAHYREAIRADASWKGAHLGLGEVDLAQNRPADADSEFRRELEIDPASVQAKAHLAEIDLMNGDTQGALDLLQEAIHLSPYGAYASFDFQPGQMDSPPAPSVPEEDKLRHVYSELQSAPVSASRSLALVILDQKLGLPALAADTKSYKETARNAADTGNLYIRAAQNADRGKYKEAEMQLRLWLGTHPEDRKALYLSARTLKSLSLQTLNRMVALDPDSPRVHQLLGQTYSDRLEDDKALAEYRIVEKAEPTLPGIHYEIGHLLWQFGDHANALAELNQELALNPDHAEANGEIGSILVVENRPEKAIPYLQTALRIDPRLQLVHQQLGKAYVMQKEYKHAEEELKQAAKNDLDGGAHYQLWVVYRAEGRTEEAAKAIEECQKIRAGRLEESRNVTRGTVTP